MTQKTPLNILVVDDDAFVRQFIQTLLEDEHRIVTATNLKEARLELKSNDIDLVFLDIALSEKESGLDLLRHIHTLGNVDVIVISGNELNHIIVECMRFGATDYLIKPINGDEVRLSIERFKKQHQLVSENSRIKRVLASKHQPVEIVGDSPAINEVKTMVRKLAGHDANVFLIGETGTGKELFARLLHQQEQQEDRPFISLNCAAIPKDLLESMLFGHERGAFTGATERRIGKFELADGGDIFLDEISCLDPNLQAKLLRVLETREVERVGSGEPKKLNFRVIAASNDNIIDLVAQNKFRRDLFYRLNTVSIHLPALRERSEDIVPLATYFLQRYRKTHEAKSLSPSAKEALEKHHWDGNIRELKNVIESAIIFAQGETIEAHDLTFVHTKTEPSPFPEADAKAPTPKAVAPRVAKGDFEAIIQRIERELILESLDASRWNKTKASKALGIKRNKLYRKMAELGIEPS